MRFFFHLCLVLLIAQACRCDVSSEESREDAAGAGWAGGDQQPQPDMGGALTGGWGQEEEDEEQDAGIGFHQANPGILPVGGAAGGEAGPGHDTPTEGDNDEEDGEDPNWDLGWAGGNWDQPQQQGEQDRPTNGGGAIQDEEQDTPTGGEGGAAVGAGVAVEQATPDEGPGLTVADPCELKCYSSRFSRRVCGTDFVTYPSQCFLDAARCQKPTVALAYEGQCTARPAVDPGLTVADPCKLKCYSSRFSRRVCGTDFVTYPSQCFLDAARCQKPTVALAYEGQCTARPAVVATQRAPTEAAGSSRPPVYGLVKDLTTALVTDLMSTDSTTMLPDEDDAGVEVVSTTRLPVPCPGHCSLIINRVCGTDGVTYQSACTLQVTACVRNDHTLQVASQGECQPAPVVDLP